MKDWHSYWQKFPASNPETAFFQQVGKTVNKKPVPEEFIKAIVASIKNNLLLDAHSKVIDLCCGNGLISKLVANYCLALTGIDYSETLIRVANKYNRIDNVSYVCGSVLDVHSLISHEVHKAYMYEALQHFTPDMLNQLFDELKLAFRGNPFWFFVGSVPDRGRRWEFYNTLSRKLDFFWKTIKNEEAIGTWWDKNNLASLCKAKKLSVQFIDQNPILHTSHYRFDMLITNHND